MVELDGVKKAAGHAFGLRMLVEHNGVHMTAEDAYNKGCALIRAAVDAGYRHPSTAPESRSDQDLVDDALAEFCPDARSFSDEQE